MNLAPDQTKVEAGGSYAKAEIHDRTALYVAILGWGAAMLSLGLGLWALDKAKDAERQMLLLREDIRELSIEQAKESK